MRRCQSPAVVGIGRRSDHRHPSCSQLWCALVFMKQTSLENNNDVVVVCCCYWLLLLFVEVVVICLVLVICCSVFVVSLQQIKRSINKLQWQQIRTNTSVGCLFCVELSIVLHSTPFTSWLCHRDGFCLLCVVAWSRWCVLFLLLFACCCWLVCGLCCLLFVLVMVMVMVIDGCDVVVDDVTLVLRIACY